MFEAEALGLAALEKIEAVRVPRVFAVGTVGDAAYLALEWIEFAAKSAEAEAELGRGLALQHRSTSTTFGWSRDNTIGSTPQLNRPCTDWPAFLRERRLRYQLDLAGRNGLPSSILGRGLSLLEQLDEFLGDHRPTPSLLHGDLWGGNWAATRAGVPFIFDPAVYYGDREADIAMTRLFGGFGDAFYAAYEAEWPLPASSERRVDLYNLYHLLNHFNLFGAGYLEAVQASIGRLERGARERS
jgi:fructosamine-3-kinase